MKSQRLSYSLFSEEDFDDYFHLVSNAEVMKMITGHPLSEKDAAERFEKIQLVHKENNEIGYYKLSSLLDGSFVGLGKLVMVGANEAEIGYVLLPEFWGKGYGSEVSEAMIKRSTEVSQIESLMAIIDPENTASKRILEKCGFSWHHDGEYYGLPAAYFKMNLSSK